MSKEDVINYVMTTPNNPNRAVLEGMLEEVSGTQLPSPTASDNGKVLGVDNGEYALVEQSGGASLFVVNGTPNGTDGTVTTDKTYEEIRSAYNSGAIVIMKLNYHSVVKNMNLTQVTPTDLMFGCAYYDDGGNNETGFMVATLKNDGTSAYRIWNQ